MTNYRVSRNVSPLPSSARETFDTVEKILFRIRFNCRNRNSWQLKSSYCRVRQKRSRNSLYFRDRSEIATFHRVKLAGLSCFKSRLQTRSIRTGISTGGVGRSAPLGGRTRRSSGWFHGLDTAPRLHRVQVLALLEMFVSFRRNDNKILITWPRVLPRCDIDEHWDCGNLIVPR